MEKHARQPRLGKSIFGIPVLFVSLICVIGLLTFAYAPHVSAQGTVVAWGSNFHGQCDVPVDLDDAIAIAAVNSHSMALKADGTVAAWGFNISGQCDVPEGLCNVIAISCGLRHSLALKADGTIVAWGDNDYGQCDVPTNLGGVIDIDSGGYYNLALKTDGTVVAWGNNFVSQCDVPEDLSEVVQIDAGISHALALKADGTFVGWGYNYYGQCDSPEIDSENPIVKMAAGWGFSLALRADGEIIAWGVNGYGQCDAPTNDPENPFISIAAGEYHCRALRADGTVVAWGDTSEYQGDVPDGLSGVIAIAAGGFHSLAITIDNSDVVAWGNETKVPSGLDNVNTIAAGSMHNMALKSDGTIFAWGNNMYGQCDVPDNDPTNPFTDIAVSLEHSLALKADGTIIAIGNNAYGANMDGQLNVPDNDPDNPFIDIAAAAGSGLHSLALKANGTVVAWGNNYHGQCNVPADLGNVIVIAAGTAHNLALKADGSIVAWGSNILGVCDVPTNDPDNPFVAVDAGSYHDLALKADGTVVAWGYNDREQCNVPADLGGVIAVAAGWEHSLALKADGTVVVWGSNYHGQCDVPAGLAGVIAISAGGGHHSLALRSSSISNQPPMSSDDAVMTNKNETVTIDLLANDIDHDGDTLTATIITSPANGSVVVNPDGTITYTPVEGFSGYDSFICKISDGMGGISFSTVRIIITDVNDPPVPGTITAPLEPIDVTGEVIVSATFSDPDQNDTHTAVWGWGDGSTTVGALDEVTGLVTGSHSYIQAGVYTVTLTVADAAQATGTSIFEYVVVYDPEMGFVTGGGWIDSPEGAFIAAPAMTGKASFGFVARYKKGANAPTGQTEFQFKAGGLNFQSSSYDWLVVAGARAQFKGDGQISGWSGDYGFMLTAIDGNLLGGDQVDKFRIKILDKATGEIVYDNQLDVSDGADPSTALGGGSIVIHNNKNEKPAPVKDPVNIDGNSMWNSHVYISWQNITHVYMSGPDNGIIDTWKVDDNGNGDPRDDENRILLNGRTDTANGISFTAGYNAGFVAEATIQKDGSGKLVLTGNNGSGDVAVEYTIYPEQKDIYGHLAFTPSQNTDFVWHIDMINNVWVDNSIGELSLYDLAMIDDMAIQARQTRSTGIPIEGQDYLLHSNVYSGEASICSSPKNWMNSMILTSSSIPVDMMSWVRMRSEYGGWPFSRYAQMRAFDLEAGQTYTFEAIFRADTLTSQEYEVILLEEDFESYPSGVGQWPENWVPDANAFNHNVSYVDNAMSSSTYGNTLKLHGAVGGCWGALAYHPVSNVSLPFKLSFDFLNENATGSGCHPFHGGVGFRSGTSWVNPAFAIIDIVENGVLNGLSIETNIILELGAWYHVDALVWNDNGMVYCDITVIDAFGNTYHDQVNRDASLFSDDNFQTFNYSHFELNSQENSVWFDNIRLTKF